MSEVHPLWCTPLLVPRVWGGRRLAERYGKPVPDGEAIGESWEVADLVEGASTIGHGPLAGQTLTAAVEAWGADLVGTAWPAGRFPLLVKLLDAQADLSVQVHPAAADCAAHFPQHHGKDESWLVLATEPGAAVIHDTVPGATWPAIAAAAEGEAIWQQLRRVDVAPGDALRVAPGIIHALLRGVVVLEIQQPSDSTFRLYDYGRGRPLHLAEAARVARCGAPGPAKLTPVATPCGWGRHELIVDLAAYRIERLTVTTGLSWTVDPRSVQSLTVTAGSGELAAGGVTLQVPCGQTILLPAALGTVRWTGAAELVLAGAGGVPMVTGEG